VLAQWDELASLGDMTSSSPGCDGLQNDAGIQAELTNLIYDSSYPMI
jgi:hypothetical protein